MPVCTVGHHVLSPVQAPGLFVIEFGTVRYRVRTNATFMINRLKDQLGITSGEHVRAINTP